MMDDIECYEENPKRNLKEKKQSRAKNLKALHLRCASSTEQSMRSLAKEKAELETVLERIRRHQLPILHIIRASNSQARSISIVDEAEQNAQMRSTIEAVEKILSVFDSSVLHPKNKEESEDHLMIEKRVLQFAANAHFIKNSYDIKPKSSITRSRSI